MRVLFISNSSNCTDGAPIALLNILYELQNYSCEFMVVTPRESEFTDRLLKLGVKYDTVDFSNEEIYPRLFPTLWSYLKYPYRISNFFFKRKLVYRKIDKIVREYKPDIIHTNVGPILYGQYIAKKYNIPHFWHIREFCEEFGMIPYPSMAYYLRCLKDGNNHCLAITKSIFSHFSLSREKDKVLYDGVFNSDEAPVVCANKENYILFVGRLSEAKGTKDLLYAYVKYMDEGGNLNLKLVGNSSQEYLIECQRIVDKYKANVSFLGRRNDVYELMQKAKMLVVPSVSEGFGFVTAEAMFNGTIVIGRNTQGTKEQLDNARDFSGEEVGYRFLGKEEIPELIRTVENLSEEQYSHKTHCAQDAVLKLYDRKLQVQELYNLYHKTLKY